MNIESISTDSGVRVTMPYSHRKPAPVAQWSTKFIVIKRFIDLSFAVIAVPLMLVLALILAFLNPFYNPGPLLFRQRRMGMAGEPIRIWKFRTMTGPVAQVRAHDAPLEESRITKLGRFLRITHIDEIPNFINVIIGEMSLVGPRPDAWGHAIKYLETVPNYRDRFLVRPGITGFAQVMVGYADTAKTIEYKARLDSFYVHRSRLLLDLYVIHKTVALLISELRSKE